MRKLIIGILIGAIVTAAIFMIVKPGGSKNVPDFKNMPDFNSENFDKSKRPSRNKDNKREDNSQTGENVNENQD